MEGEMNGAEAAYFGARPHIDNLDRRAVFRAGFERAWKRFSCLDGFEPVTVQGHAAGLETVTPNADVSSGGQD